MSQSIDQYALTSTVAQLGQKADSRFDHVASFAAESVITPGIALERGTNPQKQVLPFDGGVFAGIALLDFARENAYLTDDGVRYEETDAVSVLRKGACWVEASVEVEAGEPAYITPAGLFTNLAPDNTLIGEFLTTTDDAEQLAVVVINLP